MFKVLPIILFLVGIALLLIGYFVLESLPEIQRSKVNKRLPFTRDAESTKKWSSSTDKGYLKIHLFNITNLEAYLNEDDELLRVKEVGPIVYSYKPNITILNWTDSENLITFAKLKTYHFEPEMTKIDLNESINSVDIVAAGIADKLANYGYFKRLVADTVVNTNFKKYNTSLFFTRTIDEILFKGYDISVLFAIDSAKSSKYPDGLYGLMHNKNFTHDGIWTVNTGKDNITKLGSAYQWNHVSLNTCWKDSTETCGHIVGTDGSRFHPGLSPKTDPKVYLYSSSLYRSLSMVYKRDYIFKGIKVSRYELEDTNFILSLEQNKCYCPDKEKTINGIPMCDFNGLLDISFCKEAPIIISAPHFLYGSPELLDQIKGLEPDLSKHESYIDVDPVTGIALKGRKRLQINVYVRKHKYGHKTKDTIVPVMWIEEGQDITDEKAVLYYQAIHGLTEKASYVLIAFILIGTILIIVALILTSINIIRNNDGKMVIKGHKKKSDINHNLKYHKASTIPMDEKVANEKVKITSTEK